MNKKKLVGKLLNYRYAHRGLHQKPTIPENSMAAFQRAVEEGFGIELDVHLTRDGKLAVIHDSSLKRTCGVDLVIEDVDLAEAQGYFLEESQQRIPGLEEVLAMVGGRVPLIVELKTGKRGDGSNTTEELCRATMDALDRYEGAFGGDDERPLYCIESFDPRAVKWLQKNRPSVVRGQLAANLNKEKKTLPWFQNLLLKDLIVNWSGSPDFVAYRYEDRYEYGLMRYRGPIFFWTIRQYQDLVKAEKRGAAVIFEGFNPKEYEKDSLQR
jgi:glycerophosphoryl diester phosphodiesterase